MEAAVALYMLKGLGTNHARRQCDWEAAYRFNGFTHWHCASGDAVRGPCYLGLTGTEIDVIAVAG